MLLWEILSLVVLLFLSGFFSGTEVAFVSLTEIKLRSLLEQKKKGSGALRKLKEVPQRTIIAILIGNNLVNIGASVLATLIATDIFGSSGAGIVVGVMTFLVLVFGEITPKSYASTHGEKLILKVSGILYGLYKVLYPIIIFLEWLTDKTIQIFGHKKIDQALVSEDELKIAIEMGAEEKSIEEHEKHFMKNVLEFNDITVSEVMTERQNIFALDANLIVKDIVKILADSPYSRTPLFLGSLDKIVSIIHTKDVLSALGSENENHALRDIGVKPFFVNENVLISDLFKMFQERHTHIAIVIGTDGNTVGMITIEDLLEELVGEIIDESDVTPNKIMRIDKKTILADGETSLTYVNSFFRMNMDEVFGDIGTFVIHINNNEMPVRGQEIKYENYVFIVEEVGEGYVGRVMVKRVA